MLNMGMLFDELSEAYLKKAGVDDIIGGVPVPVNPDEEGELSTLGIALNMARVVGGDSNYPYAEQYIRYIKHIAGDDAAALIISEGAKMADRGDAELACMLFRAALAIDPKSLNALYLYGRACKEVYEREEQTEDYVGSFKAESMEAFELLTMLHPDFDMGYYFLGYDYLNLGLYTKAHITWETFLELHDEDDELKQEVEERISRLNDPVVIEQGCNKVMSGDYQGGIAILEPYMEGAYENWWPLWYYLGVAESALGNTENAISRYKKALVYSPSNTDIMKELIAMYQAVGDDTNVEKYSKKIDIILNNIREETLN